MLKNLSLSNVSVSNLIPVTSGVDIKDEGIKL